MPPSELAKPLVFFSHSSRDSEWVEHLAEQARAAGVEVYLAQNDVTPGQLIATKIVAALKASNAVMVLITPNSIVSPFVNQEIGGAVFSEKYVIPVVTKDVAGENLSMLAGREYILLDPESPTDGLARIALTLSRIIESQHDSVQRAARQRREDREDLIAVGALLLLLGLLILSERAG